MRYVKLPVVIEAFQMTRKRRGDNSEWPRWLHEAWQKEHDEPGAFFPRNHPDSDRTDELVIFTPEGLHLVGFDDWIIKGVKGELYPCKPDIFEATYGRAMEMGNDTLDEWADEILWALNMEPGPEHAQEGAGVRSILATMRAQLQQMAAAQMRHHHDDLREALRIARAALWMEFEAIWSSNAGSVPEGPTTDPDVIKEVLDPSIHDIALQVGGALRRIDEAFKYDARL